MLMLSQYSMGGISWDNVLYLSGEENCSPGQDAELTINLLCWDRVVGYACAIYLPDGFTLKKVSRIEDRGAQEIFQTTNTNDGGTMISSLNYAGKYYDFAGSDGPVAKIVVGVPDGIAPGEYEVRLARISLTNSSGTSLTVNNSDSFKWLIQATPYTITFDSNGGSPVESITLGYGSTITPPANPTREGYTFLGWDPELPTVMPQHDMMVTAQWAVNSYTLTYVVDGEVYKTSSVAYGTVITPEAAPTKEGSTFSGWSEIPATMPAHNVTVTGTFTYIDTVISDLDNVVYIDNVEGFVGQQLTLSVKMKNTVGIQTVQFDLCLPEGVIVAKDEDGFDLIELSTERTTARKMDSFSSSRVSGGAYRVLINSNHGYTFDGDDGEIVLVTVNVDPDMEEGDYPVILKDIVLVNTNSEGYETEYVKSTLTVFAYTPGDVNGDGKLNAIDLNSIVNYILEHRNFPFTFVEKAADLNGDNKINAIDVNALTNMILRGDAPQSAKKQMPVMVGTIEER